MKARGAKKLRAWLIGGYAMLMALIVLIWGFFTLGPITDLTEQQQYNSLEAIARAADVALMAEDVNPSAMLEEIANKDNVRMTLISVDGTVLADSSDEPLTMTNHARRPEIVKALQGEVGYDQRVSETDGITYMYVAIPSSYKKANCILRISEQMSQVNAVIGELRLTAMLTLAITLVVVGLIAGFVFTRTVAPMNQLERVRTDFVANASHEFKTPVAGIRLMAESIEQACEDGNYEIVTEFSKRLQRESIRLQRLVGDLMDLSRIEGDTAGHGMTDTCDFAAVVATTYESRLQRARDKGLDFVLDDRSEGDNSCRVVLSGTNAYLLVDNLVDNALTYTEEGSVSVSVGNDGDEVVLVVADTGIGIPLAEQGRVFERFYRVDTARSRESGGTGLGLALVRHAVERAGGTITLESELDKGTTFTVRLPRVKVS
ncbi:MAG: ATP-binding protein [Coriobacteriales bacterium]|nr:ATP-binding protein [Coriobacteriales bacterium]